MVENENGTVPADGLARQIADYLRQRLPEAAAVEVTQLVRIPGGASRETWSVDAKWTDRSNHTRTQGFIIRRDPPASLVQSDRRVEFAFYQSFAGTAVPVPAPLWLETESKYLDRPFFVMERIDGCESQFQKLVEPSYARYHAGLAQRMYEILADISTTPIEDLPAAKVMDVPGAARCWERELNYWEKMIDDNELEPQPIARAGIRWLRHHPPRPAQRVSVVHGDYRTGNFLYSEERIFGILDWEMAHFGDPVEDLAWSFMKAWHWARDGKPGGIVTREDATRIWEARSGLRVDPDALHWWDVFSCVKAQGIWLTGARAFAEGRSTDVMLAFTSYWLINSQDKFILEAMGKTP